MHALNKGKIKKRKRKNIPTIKSRNIRKNYQSKNSKNYSEKKLAF